MFPTRSNPHPDFILIKVVFKNNTKKIIEEEALLMPVELSSHGLFIIVALCKTVWAFYKTILTTPKYKIRG